MRLTVWNLSRLPVAPAASFVDVQGDFKTYTHTDVLTARLREVGFKYPVFAWQCVTPVEIGIETFPAGTRFVIDAHSRLRACANFDTSEVKDGTKTQQFDTVMLPYVLIQAASLDEAKVELLHLNSKYAEINPESSFLTTIPALSQIDTIFLPELTFDTRSTLDYAQTDDAPSVSSPASTERAAFPLAIVLNAAQFAAWTEYKARCQIASDTAAFLELFDTGGIDDARRE